MPQSTGNGDTHALAIHNQTLMQPFKTGLELGGAGVPEKALGRLSDGVSYRVRGYVYPSARKPLETLGYSK